MIATTRKIMGRIVYGDPRTNKRKLMNALRVPQVGEEARRERNLRGPPFGIELRFLVIAIAVLFLYCLIAHPTTWHSLFQLLGVSNPKPTTATTEL